MAYISGIVYDDTGAAVGGRTVRAYRRDTGAFLGETTSVSSAVAGDSNFASVVLLLSGNGANDGTTITDTSLVGRTVTRNGDTKTSTTQSKFGGSSIYFDGTGDYLSLESSADFGFGTGAFTIEFFARFVSLSNGPMLFDMRPGSNGAYIGGWGTASSGLTGYGANSATKAESSTGVLSTDTWHHLALCRSGTTGRIFVNGTQVASGSDSINYATTGIRFGRNVFTNSQDINAYVNSLRITKGVARYTADFTVPDVAFPACSIDLTTGGFYIPTSYTGEVNVVTLDDSGGTTYNDKILRTTPV